MPVTATDIVFYGSQVMPEDEVTLDIGGAIDLTTIVTFTDIGGSPSLIEVLSDNVGDTTQGLTVVGRAPGGSIITETFTLNGTTVVPFSLNYERILKFELDAVGAGIVTVRKASDTGDLAIFPAGVTTVRRVFYLASSDVLGGAAREYHDKIFVKNEHATLDLTQASIVEQSDPGANITFDLESTLDGTDSNGGANNRLVEPGGYTFDSATKAVANSGNHTAQAAQGIWIKLSLAAGDAPAKNIYTFRELGKTI